MLIFRVRRLPLLAALFGGSVLCACQNSAHSGLPALEGPNALAAAVVAEPPSSAALQAEAQAAADTASTGTLRARELAALGPKETGVLLAIHVAEGDRVRRGQPLFRLDSKQLELAVEQANAALSSAKLHARAARTHFERVQGLSQRGSVATELFDQSKAQLESADSAVLEAQAALDATSHRLGNMVVSSPIDGVVTEKRMNVGELATLMPPSVVLVVQNIDQLELRARLPEAALGSMSEGASLELRFPALGLTRQVPVKRIAPTVDPRTRTVEVIADLDNRDHRLRAGMLVEVGYAQAASSAAVATSLKPKAAHSGAAP